MAKQKNKSAFKTIKVIFGLLILAGLVYLIKTSIDAYQKQTEAIGIVVCSEEECVKTMHIHADIEFDLCGQNPVLPREGGELSGLHTHKEKNYLHFHDKVKLDPETKEQEFDQRLTLQEVIDMFELEPKNFCKNAEAEIQILVKHSNHFKDYDEAWSEVELNYNWQDGDLIKLTYQE